MRRADSWPFVHSRQGKIVAVVWTHKKHRIVPTKKRASEVVSVWKKWKERHGEKVMKLDTSHTRWI